MPEFFLELFSEEIPARMQAGAARELERICMHALQFLKPSSPQTFYGPRRIAFSAIVNADDSAGKSDRVEARGPREGAPASAIEGFLRKFGGEQKDLLVENGYYVLRRKLAPETAHAVIDKQLPKFLAQFAWPKSMRWGQSGNFTWVRPLRRIVCLLDGKIIPIRLGPVTAGNETEGHRFLSPGTFVVSSVAGWVRELRARHVIADAAERRAAILSGLQAKAEAMALTLSADDALLDEVTGLVEWPVPLIGKIGMEFMALPPEVRELSMKVNQRYFALRDALGQPAPYFAFVANIEAEDGGAAIIAGNERVLRARLADARHFWDQDNKMRLDQLLPKLKKITFHAKIGTQFERAERIRDLAGMIADRLYADSDEKAQAEWAGLLCKADLVTGMVGEFPELQGIMGGYYAERHFHGWDGKVVGPAIRTHYQPKGPNDEVPAGICAVSVALADKLDTLIQFFEISEKPSGSGDPYALRRAALGVIRIILENELELPLRPLLGFDENLSPSIEQTHRAHRAMLYIQNPRMVELFDFILERLRVKLRGEGQRFDILDAVLGAGTDDDLLRIMRRVNAVAAFLGTPDGANLLAAYRRAANILRIEDAKDGPHTAYQGQPHLQSAEADELRRTLDGMDIAPSYEAGDYAAVMAALARLRAPVDAFFEHVTVNADDPELRRNRLQLLAKLRDTMHLIADFSKIEG